MLERILKEKNKTIQELLNETFGNKYYPSDIIRENLLRYSPSNIKPDTSNYTKKSKTLAKKLPKKTLKAKLKI